VPEEVVEAVMEDVDDWDEERLWGNIQKWLGSNGMSRYYNRIPYIIEEMGLGEVIVGTKANVVDKFIEMSEKFDAIKHGLERSYFPCLRYSSGNKRYSSGNERYVAIRLLSDFGAEFRFSIPIVKTPCKVVVLDEIYNILLTDSYC
jgi:hypothetical protein